MTLNKINKIKLSNFLIQVMFSLNLKQLKKNQFLLKSNLVI
jgi:hypothetical protein